MRRLLIYTLVLAFVANANAQTKSKPKSTSKTGTQSQSTPMTLKTALDSFSYAMGMSVGKFCNQQGIESIKTPFVLKGIGDASKKDSKPLLTEQQMNFVIQNYLGQIKKEKSANARLEGEKFLAENAKKPGVVTLASGLQYMILKTGTDTTHPKLTDQVRAHYHGTLINGQVFESSYERGQPVVFSVDGVISGWTEALQLMTVGSKWRLFIPFNLAYGDQQAGPNIAPGSTLIFDVELL